jgi:hypothetical protein
MNANSGRRQTRVERVHHTPSEERRVPQVHVVTAVAGQHGEPVVGRQPELRPVGVGQAQ